MGCIADQAAKLRTLGDLIKVPLGGARILEIQYMWICDEWEAGQPVNKRKGYVTHCEGLASLDKKSWDTLGEIEEAATSC
ncbi:hypothetical protein [Magnetococcus sp. PR-3]|uniref:hypothetical protein n=1 Tax=Magnetococcus sp. PR-3 TaxID=3120355 RepID=UPI002FCE50A0